MTAAAAAAATVITKHFFMVSLLLTVLEILGLLRAQVDRHAARVLQRLRSF
ncbi:hypothetical protein H6A60_04210 [Sutterella massiliensis]|uniref:Uncharacterized protein n=1 Tax=Sutterella massiliensis TaxID=1816689 RepID=A0ABS2DRC6_9BURK|nr:hypothetical protein [Sutterella massiliensis]MBM6703692.1 hypothetical protein [Sutterella massiliensis]